MAAQTRSWATGTIGIARVPGALAANVAVVTLPLPREPSELVTSLPCLTTSAAQARAYSHGDRSRRWRWLELNTKEVNGGGRCMLDAVQLGSCQLLLWAATSRVREESCEHRLGVHQVAWDPSRQVRHRALTLVPDL